MRLAALGPFLVVVAVALGGCSDLVDDAADILAGSRPLRTQPSPGPGEEPECMAAAEFGALGADPADPALVWIVDFAGARREVLWPYGFRVRFSPDAELLAPDGVVLAREGEELFLGGGPAPGGAFAACTVNGWSPWTGSPSEVESP